jgi:hypothetical protein
VSGFAPSNFGDPVAGLDNQIAAGVTQLDAPAIKSKLNYFTVVPDGSGCVLPSAFQPQSWIYVMNRVGDGTNLLVYPSSGDQIEGREIDVPVTIPDGGGAGFWCGNTSPIAPKPRLWRLTP